MIALISDLAFALGTFAFQGQDIQIPVKGLVTAGDIVPPIFETVATLTETSPQENFPIYQLFCLFPVF